MKEDQTVETQIDRYVRENTLTEGSYLPPDDKLAVILGCDAETVAAALLAAQRKGKVVRQSDGKVMLSSLPVLRDQEAFSFTQSAQVHGESLVTELLEEPKIRFPLEDKENPISKVEERACHALGLKKQTPLLVITRLRRLHGEPRAIHRAYLDPAKFPEKFLKAHNFETESLIHIYSQYGYELVSRDTTLTSRFPNLYEREVLKEILHGSLFPVLDAEQKLFAKTQDSEERFVLEYLQASYVNWRYEIKNRPAPSPIADPIGWTEIAKK